MTQVVIGNSVAMSWPLLAAISGAPLAFRINSIEQLSAVQTKLKFDAPAGRTVSVQTSTNLANWIDRTSVSVGLSGSAETTVSVTGDKTFLRLAYPN